MLERRPAGRVAEPSLNSWFRMVQISPPPNRKTKFTAPGNRVSVKPFSDRGAQLTTSIGSKGQSQGASQKKSVSNFFSCPQRLSDFLPARPKVIHPCVCPLQKPVPDPPYIHRHHRVCTYSQMRHATVRLPGCQPNVSSLYHYPVALRCHCAVCSTQDTECETF